VLAFPKKEKGKGETREKTEKDTLHFLCEFAGSGFDPALQKLQCSHLS